MELYFSQNFNCFFLFLSFFKKDSEELISKLTAQLEFERNQAIQWSEQVVELEKMTKSSIAASEKENSSEVNEKVTALQKQGI